MRKLQQRLSPLPRLMGLLTLLGACAGRTVELDRDATESAAPEPQLKSTLVIGEHATRLWTFGDRLLWMTTLYVGENGDLRGCRTSACQDTVLAYDVAVPDSVIGSPARVAFSLGGIRSCLLEGCDRKSSVVYGADATQLALDADHVYWLATWDLSVYSCPLSGCETPTTVAAKQSTNDNSIFVVDGEAYWRVEDELRHAKTDGSEPYQVVVKHRSMNQLTLTSGYAYFVDEQQHILRCSLSGCTEPEPVVTTDTPKFTLRADAKGVFWLERDDAVHACAASGCDAGPSSVTPPQVYAFAIDDEFVYWSERIEGDAKQPSPTMESGVIGGNIRRSSR